MSRSREKLRGAVCSLDCAQATTTKTKQIAVTVLSFTPKLYTIRTTRSRGADKTTITKSGAAPFPFSGGCVFTTSLVLILEISSRVRRDSAIWPYAESVGLCPDSISLFEKQACSSPDHQITQSPDRNGAMTR